MGANPDGLLYYTAFFRWGVPVDYGGAGGGVCGLRRCRWGVSVDYGGVGPLPVNIWERAK